MSPIETQMRRGSVVGVYIKECVTYKTRNDIIRLKDSFEHLWIEKAKIKIHLIWFELSTNLALDAKKIELLKKRRQIYLWSRALGTAL